MDTISHATPDGKPHYVYALAYPESMGGYMFYIGKGCGRRITEHEQRVRKEGIDRKGKNRYKDSVIKKIWNAHEEIVKIKLAFFTTHDEALEYEAALIFFMKGYNHLTNLSFGWDTRRSPLAEEYREHFRKTSTGRFHSEETRKQMSEAAKKRGFTSEHRRKITESLRGKTHSEEHKRKIREGQTYLHTEEYRQQQRDLLNKRAESEEYRQQQREGAKKQWADPETRVKMIEAQRQRRTREQQQKQ